jgi:hypothetical protein
LPACLFAIRALRKTNESPLHPGTRFNKIAYQIGQRQSNQLATVALASRAVN